MRDNANFDTRLNTVYEEFATLPDSIIDFCKFSIFHRKYSLNNQLLIFSQAKNSKILANFQFWKKKGIKVLTGSKTIKILANNGNKGYKTLYMFADCQTDIKHNEQRRLLSDFEKYFKKNYIEKALKMTELRDYRLNNSNKFELYVINKFSENLVKETFNILTSFSEDYLNLFNSLNHEDKINFLKKILVLSSIKIQELCVNIDSLDIINNQQKKTENELII